MTFWHVVLCFAPYVLAMVYVMFRGDFDQGPLWQRVLLLILAAHVGVTVALFIAGPIMFGLLPMAVGDWIFGKQRFGAIMFSMIGSLLAIAGLYLACDFLRRVWNWMRGRKPLN